MIGKLTGEGVVAVVDVKKNHCNFHIETATFEPRHENKVVQHVPRSKLDNLTN